MNNDQRKKRMLALGIGLLVVLFGFQAILFLSRIGEKKVKITVIPSTAEVFVDDREVGGSVYLANGEYTFKARAEGYKDDEFKVSVGEGKNVVELIPSPESPEAIEFLDDNPAIQAKREAIGGRRSEQLGDKVKNETPILSKLPVTDISGPFSIDYGGSGDREYGSFLLVSDSSPKGRASALKWIKQQGVDPTDLEIKFADFYNPLTEGAAQ